MNKERRAYPRYFADGRVDIVGSSGLYHLALSNISLGGALLIGTSSTEVGDAVFASLDLGVSDTGERLSATLEARVVRKEEDHGIALEWRDADGKVAGEIASLVESVATT